MYVGGGYKCLQKFYREISWKTSTWKKEEEIGEALYFNITGQ
jgi:hypothetical protein